MRARILIRPAVLLSLALIAACASTPKPAPIPSAKAKVSSTHFDYGRPYLIEAQPPLQCVAYARLQTGIEIYGNANRWWTKAAGHYRRGTSPRPGAVMVLKGYKTDRRGHLAVVRKIVDTRTLIIDHANWLGRGEINRDVPVLDVSPGNDWSQVKVWYIPAGQWGARINTVEGFIYPDQTVASR
jgi:hypothetical protein